MAALKHEFAKILEGLLEGEHATGRGPAQAAAAPAAHVFFDWIPALARVAQPSAMAKAYPRPSPMPVPPAKKKVFTLKTESLTENELAAAKQLFEAAKTPLPRVLTETEVKRVFRIIAKTHHPDRHVTGSQQDRQAGALLFGQSNRVYRMVVKALRSRGTLS